MLSRTLILLIPSLFTACTDQGEFPSLARRPVEKASLAPPAPPPVVPANPELMSRIDYTAGKAREGAPAFELSLEAAQVVVGRGGSVGSENWIAAQLAVSRLETTLSPAREALSALDGERSGVVTKGSTADLQALETAISEVEAIDQRQSEAMRKLLDALNR